ncbi:hypothetical protein CXG81DRAFT_12866 [Caulochytrium protostelioides]|uniref:MFS general substrate transporter n=1 Tax=Caulochytrium protostelioides TaxID=1555241 RepID=A0A4V1ITG8_9FUNG|nr:hypothetical protein CAUPRSCDRAFT_7159 [Caulochytrium protostelioides]RKP00742.1 hypothetical protein CXG81DRAFT_12866 [Caulochytrium protostelioides]|eukprot:RKP00742.1 hypothetical protein CXG81DRAFT_12866 [Caulochytrium protostelioides]
MGYQARGWSVEPIVWKPFLAGLVASLVHHRDFRLVFLSRFFFQMGIATVQGFLQYFVSDCLVTDLPPTVAVSVVMLPLLVLSPISAALAPRDAPRRVVYAAAAVMVWACLCLASLRSFLAVMAVCGVFGIAYGPFMSVEFAMVIAVLPDPKTAARDISLWHTALVLPQIMASPIAGMLRDALQPVGNDLGVVCLGYKVVYVVCIGYLLLGVLATRLIRSID